jgi:hypothetical protein
MIAVNNKNRRSDETIIFIVVVAVSLPHWGFLGRMYNNQPSWFLCVWVRCCRVFHEFVRHSASLLGPKGLFSDSFHLGFFSSRYLFLGW